MKLIFILFVLSLLPQAFACTYDLSTPLLTYTVSDNNPTVPGTVSVTRSGSNSSACDNIFLAFTKGWAGSYTRRATNTSNGNYVYYNVYKNSNSTGILKEPSDITSPNETLLSAIGKTETKTFTYYFTLAAFGTTPPAAGTYFDDIQVQAYSGFYTSINAYEGYKDLYLYIIVPQFTSIALVDNGGTYDPAQTSKTLDFGELSTSEELSFDVRVVSNAGYRLKVSSSNNGILQRVGGTGLTSQIGYTFYANGSQIGLGSSASTPVTIASGTGVTSSQGVRVPIRVVIGTVDTNKDAGTYQDYITLTTITTD